MRVALLSFLFLATLLRADQGIEKLYLHKDWLRLLYYKSTITGYKSYMTNDGFFISPQGRRDPKVEMLASIEAIQKDDGFQNKFPLRYKFLNTHLNLKPYMPTPEKKYKKIYLVFPNIFTKAVASMFGHLYIALEEDSFVDAEVIHFGAITGDAGGLAYLYKGLMGGFDADYIKERNYTKLKEYSVMESRDIFLYELDFSEEMIDDFVLHMEELKHAITKYYFLDENCAFFLAKSLEVVIKQDLIDDLFVIPSYVANSLYDLGLIRETSFKRADLDIFEAKYQKLNNKQKAEVVSLIKEEWTQEPPSDEVVEAFLDISVYMIYNYSVYYDSIRKNRIKALGWRRDSGKTYIQNDFVPTKTKRIKNQELKAYLFGGDDFGVFYRPMYYGDFNNFEHIYNVNIETVSLEYTKKENQTLGLHLFNLKSFVPRSDVLNNISWSTRYTIYTDLDDPKFLNRFKLNFGYSQMFLGEILLYELVGIETGNFDDLNNRQKDSFFEFSPIVGAKWSINGKNIIEISIKQREKSLYSEASYKYKMNESFGLEAEYIYHDSRSYSRFGISYIF